MTVARTILALAVSLVALGYLGTLQPEGWSLIFARLFSIYYFAYFLIILPVLGKVEKTKPLPGSISEAVLRRATAVGASAPAPSGIHRA